MPHLSREQATSAYVVSTTTHSYGGPIQRWRVEPIPRSGAIPARGDPVTNEELRDIHDRRLKRSRYVRYE